ncbi:hypothetical protein ACP70R_007636 [Stipagrostis hirtigluma subsp. patula]
MMLCTTERVEEAAAAAAAAGELGGPVKEGSTKRKAATGSTEGEKAAAGADPASAVGGGIAMGEKHAADVATAAEQTGGEEWVPGGGTRLPKEFVDWILRRKRAVLQEDPDDYYNRMINDPDRPAVYTPEFLEEEREVLRSMAALYKSVGDRFEKFQEWVRGELEAKGYVEVGDAYLAQRARLRRVVTQERWNAMVRDLRLEDDDDKGVKNSGAAGGAVESN